METYLIACQGLTQPEGTVIPCLVSLFNLQDARSSNADGSVSIFLCIECFQKENLNKKTQPTSLDASPMVPIKITC